MSPTHGKVSTYRRNGCRCDECREAARVSMAGWRAGKTGVIEGGTDIYMHCTDCGETERGWAEWKTWQLATRHVRDTGHLVMITRRTSLGPASKIQ